MRFTRVFRSGRFLYGNSFLDLVYLLSILNLRRLPNLLSKAAIKWILLAIICITYLWFVVQTRSTMAVLTIMTFLVFRKKTFRIIQLGSLGSIIILFIFALSPDFIEKQINIFQDLYSEATQDNQPRVREVTLQIIIDEVYDNNLLGMGALSLQWKRGFHRIYNKNFYLSDVGLFGVWYRFGILAIPLCLFYYRNNLSWVFGISSRNLPLINALRYLIVFSLLNPVFSNIIVFGGQVYGIYFAILAYLNLLQSSKTTNSLANLKFKQPLTKHHSWKDEYS